MQQGIFFNFNVLFKLSFQANTVDFSDETLAQAEITSSAFGKAMLTAQIDRDLFKINHDFLWSRVGSRYFSISSILE